MQNLKKTISIMISISGLFVSCKSDNETLISLKEPDTADNLSGISSTTPPTCIMAITFVPNTDTNNSDTTQPVISEITHCNTILTQNPNPHRDVTCRYTDGNDNPQSVSLIESSAGLPAFTGMAGASLSPSCKIDTLITCEVVTAQGTLSNNFFYCNRIFQTIPTLLIFD